MTEIKQTAKLKNGSKPPWPFNYRVHIDAVDGIPELLTCTQKEYRQLLDEAKEAIDRNEVYPKLWDLSVKAKDLARFEQRVGSTEAAWWACAACMSALNPYCNLEQIMSEAQNARHFALKARSSTKESERA